LSKPSLERYTEDSRNRRQKSPYGETKESKHSKAHDCSTSNQSNNRSDRDNTIHRDTWQFHHHKRYLNGDRKPSPRNWGHYSWKSNIKFPTNRTYNHEEHPSNNQYSKRTRKENYDGFHTTCTYEDENSPPNRRKT
ncbi:unnamed protein product, partial [Meganyctiphanes norvegica]